MWLKEGAKAVLKAVSPGLHETLRVRYSGPARRTKRLGDRLGWRVAAGPFAGLAYVRRSHGSRLLPKLVGSYEQEIHAWIDRLVCAAPATIVNVGCAEGYYAVGFARAMPDSRVLAFDTAAAARARTAELAAVNGVTDRIELGGTCDAATLNRLDLAGALVVCDCEGYERELLDPAASPGLKDATILVEFHDCFFPGTTNLVLERFAATHTVETATARPRDPTGYSAVRDFAPDDAAFAVDEERETTAGPQVWALLTPR